ncbi:unnamed protein product [Adineta steineri]|uniref:EGF-like domain-containing protein n=1 Tax=Adineta steineri TaxID=433720 RepID=A0A814EIZ9_9BILA|nr:unnamed protein product [Adineta steineri]CAF1037278.1 unnamed protein product [Adineta steineri]
MSTSIAQINLTSKSVFETTTNSISQTKNTFTTINTDIPQLPVISYNLPKFCPNATWEQTRNIFANDSVLGNFTYDFFIDRNNTVYIAAFDMNQIVIFHEENDTPMILMNEDLTKPHSLFVMTNNDIYVTYDTDSSNIYHWTSVNWTNGGTYGAYDTNPPNIYHWTNQGIPITPSKTCGALFMDINYNIYCSLYYTHQIMKYPSSSSTNNSGIRAAGNGSSGNLSNLLTNPMGIFVDTNFNLYVADSGNNRIQLFKPGDTNGITVVGSVSSSNFVLHKPTSVILDGNGYLFIVDSNNNRIIMSGLLYTRCIIGCEDGLSFSPYFIRFDSYGNIYASAFNSSHIQKFTLITDLCDFDRSTIAHTGTTNTQIQYNTNSTAKPNSITTLTNAVSQYTTEQDKLTTFSQTSYKQITNTTMSNLQSLILSTISPNSSLIQNATTSIHHDFTDSTTLSTQTMNYTIIQNETSSMANDFTTIQYDESLIENTMTTTETDISTMADDSTTIEYDESSRENNMTTAETDISPMANDITTIQYDESLIENTMTTAEADISPMADDIITTQYDESLIENTMTTAEIDKSTMANDFTTTQYDNTLTGNTMTTTKADKSTIANHITTIQYNKTSIENTLTTRKTDISTMANDIITIQYDKTSIENIMTTTKADKSTIANDITTTQYGKISIENTLTTRKTDISSMANDITLTQYDSTLIENTMTTRKTDISPMANHITTAHYDKSLIANNMTTAETAISTMVDTIHTIKPISSIFQPFIANICQNSSRIGFFCNISSTTCDLLNPCQNMGTCSNNHSVPLGYTCACQPGFNGTNCQLDIRLCKPTTCWNNGIYFLSYLSFTKFSILGNCSISFGNNSLCSCTYGWEGLYCQNKVNYCQNVTCLNNGICQSLFLGYKCECISTFYTGSHCEFIDESLIIKQYVSKSFASIAIIAISTVAISIIVLDIMTYIFHIDVTRHYRDQWLRKRALEKQKSKIPMPRRMAYRFIYIHHPSLAEHSV